ncbi:MAG: CHAT domain-containing protein, partial [Bacteroidota bacterium]
MIRQITGNQQYISETTPEKKKALIIANPKVKEDWNLPKAQEEGLLIKALLEENGYEVDAFINSSAETIRKALFARSYSLIHIAAHGVITNHDIHPDNENEIGLVIADNDILTPIELEQLSYSPDFVFVNACSLGKILTKESDFTINGYHYLQQQQNRIGAGFGLALMRRGVKAAVLTGWKVRDDLARDFAYNVYNKLFDGYIFGESIRLARFDLFSRVGNGSDNNTWGAYQAYGYPFFSFAENPIQNRKQNTYYDESELILEVENVRSAGKTNFHRGSKTLVKKLTQLEKEAARLKISKTGPFYLKLADAYYTIQELPLHNTAYSKVFPDTVQKLEQLKDGKNEITLSGDEILANYDHFLLFIRAKFKLAFNLRNSDRKGALHSAREGLILLNSIQGFNLTNSKYYTAFAASYKRLIIFDKKEEWEKIGLGLDDYPEIIQRVELEYRNARSDYYLGDKSYLFLNEIRMRALLIGIGYKPQDKEWSNPPLTQKHRPNSPINKIKLANNLKGLVKNLTQASATF